MARRSSGFGAVVVDLAHAVSRLPPVWSLVLGLGSFFLFYFLLPSWITQQVEALEGNHYQELIAVRFHYVIRASHWTGIGCAVVGLYYAVRNSFTSGRSGKGENRIVGVLSRLIGRGMD